MNPQPMWEEEVPDVFEKTPDLEPTPAETKPVMGDKELTLRMQVAKFESQILWTCRMPGLDDPGEIGLLFFTAQQLVGASKDPLKIVEVGPYGGRLSLPLSCAFLGTTSTLYLVDDFKGLRPKDPDTLVDPWKRFRLSEEVSGMDMWSWVNYNLHFCGLDKQVEIRRVDPKVHAEKSWKDKIDLLILNNLWTYKNALDVSNAWLPHLRNGKSVVFLDAQNEHVQAVVRELVMVKKWPVVQQVQAGGRMMVVLTRPLDETSGT